MNVFAKAKADEPQVNVNGNESIERSGVEKKRQERNLTTSANIRSGDVCMCCFQGQVVAGAHFNHRAGVYRKYEKKACKFL